MSKIKNIIPLFLILVLGLVLRLYKVNSPLADHHSWRQTDSAAVIRNLAFDKFDVLRPQWNNFVHTNAANKPNPNRYFFEDFPLAFDVYPALLLKFLGNNVLVLRLGSIVFSLLTLVFLYLFISDITNKRTGLIAAGLYAVLPYSVFFTRGVFQEIPLNLYAVASLFFLNRYLKKEKIALFVAAIIFNCLLFLTKPYALVFLLPEMVLFWQKEKFSLVKNRKMYLYFGLSLVPFIAWWFWVRRFPEGIPYSGWLLNEGNIRFKGSFFYWIFAERLGTLIMGIWGVLFLGAGLFAFNGLKDLVFYVWLAALFVYVSVIAKGNVTHDYYQIPFVPVISYFMAKGISFLLGYQKKVNEKIMALVLVGFILALALAFSWYNVRGFYNLQSGVDLAGDFVDKNVPEDALVIAGDGADPTLLYNTNRKGWTVGYGSRYENTPDVIQKLKTEGAGYYVTTTLGQIKSTSFYQSMKEKYPVIKETDQFIIFKLTN